MQCCAGQFVVGGGDAIGVDGLLHVIGGATLLLTGVDDDDDAVNRSILKDCCCCIRELGSGGVGNGTSFCGGGDAVEGRKGADTPGAYRHSCRCLTQVPQGKYPSQPVLRFRHRSQALATLIFLADLVVPGTGESTPSNALIISPAPVLC